MSGLIDRQAVFDTIHRFFTEEVDKIPTKKTEDGEVLIMCKAQPLFEMNKAICKRIKALPSASPTQNCVENALDALDCISRDAVEDKLLKLCNELEGIFANIRMQNQDESVCGLCEYDCPEPYECPGFDIEDCFKLADEIRHKWQSTKDLPPVNPQEPYDFAEWVAREIFDEMWEYNKDAFAEIACRKLAKLGIVRAKGDEWELVEPQESEDAE